MNTGFHSEPVVEQLPNVGNLQYEGLEQSVPGIAHYERLPDIVSLNLPSHAADQSFQERLEPQVSPPRQQLTDQGLSTHHDTGLGTRAYRDATCDSRSLPNQYGGGMALEKEEARPRRGGGRQASK